MRNPELRKPGYANNIYMIPDRAFRKELKNLSKRLDVFWNPNEEKWEIWEKGNSGGWHLVYRIVNGDGSYRPLDERTITLMKLCDIQRKPYRDWCGLAKLMTEYEKHFEDDVLRHAANEMADRWQQSGGEKILRDAYSIQVPGQIV